jgi:hypothetical protein
MPFIALKVKSAFGSGSQVTLNQWTLKAFFSRLCAFRMALREDGGSGSKRRE